MTFRERVLHLGLEASFTHPGPSTGSLRVGFILLATVKDKMLQLWDILTPVPRQGLERAEVISSNKLRKFKKIQMHVSKKTGFF